MSAFRLLHVAIFAARVATLDLAAEEGGDVPPSPPVSSSPEAIPAYYTYRVVHAWPHDPEAFTQGLVYRNGELLESTGLYGQSTLREVNLESGKTVKKISLKGEFFGEGLAVVGTRAFQLTWQNHKGFVYNADSFANEGEFSYSGEGWGLTSDGRLLVLSDGTDEIRFIDPASFQVVRTIRVLLDGHPLGSLNELEWVRGEIFANVWQTDEIVRVDPQTGRVLGVIDLYGLLAPSERGPETDVLNGIAFDPALDRLFVTGKRWPKIFEVRLLLK
jgi:glutamine cyclotransferase